MHVARPKSAKGRTRPSFSHSLSVEACPCRVPSSTPPAAPCKSLSSRRASATNLAFLSGQASPAEIPELLRQVPLRTSSSLNRYRVLPSIGWKGAGSSPVEAVAEQTDRPQASGSQEGALKIKTLSGEEGSADILSQSRGPAEESSHMPRPPEKLGRKLRQESSLTLKEELPLLLAIRSPSGQRFEHHFSPTDSLQAVLAVAEQKTSAKYKSCSIETTDVPRRSFSDLTRSLHECGILHKSVLCIRQKGQHDPDL